MIRFALGAVSIAISAACSAAPGDEIYSRPGQLIDTSDGARLNFVCIGSGSPTVVFDAGFSDWSPAWALVHPKIAVFTQACTYDRAGSGFSGSGPFPRTTERIARELHDALKHDRITGPYVLVGSSFGGDNVRAFADLFPSDVAGLVLVDGDASDVDTPQNRADDDRDNVGYLSTLRPCRNAIAAGNPTFSLPPPPGRPSRMCAQIFFRGLPESEWSPELNARLLELGERKVAMWDAIISEMEQVPADEIWLQQHRQTLGNTPVRILTSGNHAVGHLDRLPEPTIEHLKYEYDRAVAQSHWLTLSTDAKQIFVKDSSEYIQFDRPDAVVDTVREVVERNRRPR